MAVRVEIDQGRYRDNGAGPTRGARLSGDEPQSRQHRGLEHFDPDRPGRVAADRSGQIGANRHAVRRSVWPRRNTPRTTRLLPSIDPPKVRLLGKLGLLEARLSAVAGRPRSPLAGGQTSSLRMVHPDPDFRLVHHPLLRGHLPGRESASDEHLALDQHGVRHPLRPRNGHQMVRPGSQVLLLVRLDGPGFRHRHGFSHQRGRRRFRQPVGS